MNNLDKLEKNFIYKKIDSETINIQILNNNLLMAIVGSFNENLLNLEKLTETTIFFRGNSLTIKGQSQNTSLVLSAIKFLIDKFVLTNVIEKNDIVIQVNGKKRGIISIDKEASEENIISEISKRKLIEKYLYGGEIVKTIYVKNRIINYLIK